MFGCVNVCICKISKVKRVFKCCIMWSFKAPLCEPQPIEGTQIIAMLQKNQIIKISSSITAFIAFNLPPFSVSHIMFLRVLVQVSPYSGPSWVSVSTQASRAMCRESLKATGANQPLTFYSRTSVIQTLLIQSLFESALLFRSFLLKSLMHYIVDMEYVSLHQ